MSTTTTRNRTFTSDTGRTCTVWNVRTVGRNVTGFTGWDETVRTFVTVEGTDEEFDVEPGCSFQSERVVRNSGF